jgi:hypothetical protein
VNSGATYHGTDVHAGELTIADGARIGATDFGAWLHTHLQEAER